MQGTTHEKVRTLQVVTGKVSSGGVAAGIADLL